MNGYPEDEDRGNVETEKQAGSAPDEDQEDGEGGDTPMGAPFREKVELSLARAQGAPYGGKRDRKRCLYQIISICVLLTGGAVFGRWSIASRLDMTGTTISNGIESTSILTSGQLTETLSITEIANLAAPSVVEITTEIVVTGQRASQYISEGAGSGVILTTDGYIVTNNHVIEDAQKITVRLSAGAEYEATLVGTDTQTDIAILRIDATGLTPATIGDSSTLDVGGLVVAIGNPLGELGGTVTDGIISALDREITLDDETMNLLQTNAAINPGNSGGGLFDGAGNLIGIVVAKSSGSDVEGLGFAIPINDVKDVMAELIQYGYVLGRIELGMTFLDIDSNQAAMMYRVSQTGTYILEVVSGTNADSAGFVSGDCILTIDGTKITTSADITSIIEEHEVGDTLNITILRSSEKMSLQLVLQENKPIN